MKITKGKQRFIMGILLVGMITLLGNAHGVKAAIQSAEAETMEEGVRVMIIHSTPSQTLTLTRASGNIKASVIGEGIRLRKKASSTSAVLELMYMGEIVVVKDNSRETWWKVQRCKTGTVGYVNKKYLTY